MYELGRRFQFFINKIENNTLHISQIIQNNNSENIDLSNLASLTDASSPCFQTSNNYANFSSNTNGTSIGYDSSGAAKYIVVVVLVYGFGIIFFIGSQVRSTKKFSDEVDGVNAEKILRSMETEIFTKEVLGILNEEEFLLFS
jgi:hypothetical protein